MKNAKRKHREERLEENKKTKNDQLRKISHFIQAKIFNNFLYIILLNLELQINWNSDEISEMDKEMAMKEINKLVRLKHKSDKHMGILPTLA